MATLSGFSLVVTCQPHHHKPQGFMIPRPVRHMPPQAAALVPWASTCTSTPRLEVDLAPDSLPRTCVVQSMGEAEGMCPCGEEESPLTTSSALSHLQHQLLSCPGSTLSWTADLTAEVFSNGGILECLVQ